MSAFMKEHFISMVPVALRKSLSYTIRALAFLASLKRVKDSLEGKTMELWVFIHVMLNRAAFHNTENVLPVVQCPNTCGSKQGSLISEIG